jgi:serine/threonine-protein kinase
MSSQPPPLALLNGRYRLLAAVASGGMATVYKAQDTLLSRLVAVKVLRERLAQDPQFVQRFREEAQAAANLNHPNIVTIYDVGRDQAPGVERHYIVMEYVEGQDLKQRIRAGAAVGRALGIEEAVEFARQVCEGVGSAHRRGLVHCDLKPQNVLITPEGKVKVADFGIARAYTSLVAERADVVWGTPQYYSPEQATGAAPTPASDVYSIGVMLFEMLTGRLPFEARDPQELARQHLNAEPPDLHALNPNVTLQLEAIVRRALSKDPANRYRDAEQMARVLTAYLQQGEEQTINQPAVAPASLTGRAPAARTPAPGASSPLRPAPVPGAPTGSRTAPPAAGRGGTMATGRAGQGHGVEAAPAESGVDLLVWLLGALAVLCVLGLIPLYALVLRTYSSPAPTPASPANPTFQVTLSGTASTLTITPSLVLPSFLGMSPEQASQGLQTLGLVPVIEERPDPDAAQARVIEQRPAAGATLSQGSAVNLVVGMPALSQVVPPDLIGRVLDAPLSQTLRAVGWTVVVSDVFSFQPENLIVSLTPPGGSKLAVSGTLTLTVSNGGRVPLNVNLSPVMLDWARFDQERYAPGQVLRFAALWRAVGRVGASYKVFVHLFGPDGALVAQPPDREPMNNGSPAPTATWSAGTVVYDTYAVDIPADARSGQYHLEIGLYNDQERLRVVDYGNTPPQPDGVNSVTVRAFQVGP